MPSELLKGSYDLHIHTEPDVSKRKLNDLEMAKRAQEVGMKGFCIKSHYFATVERAKLAKEIYPDVNVLGSIVLNNFVGGFSAYTLEVAARSGTKIVWMPTFDSLNEQQFFRSGKYEKLPFWAKLQSELNEQGFEPEHLSVFDENGVIKKSVLSLLDIIAKYEMVLATSHLSKEETYALVKAAKEHKVNRIIVTHPNFPSTYYTKEEQKELAEMGAYMEHCFTTPHTGKVSWDKVIEQIKYVGPEYCILSTDLGQPTAVYPDEGLKLFYEKLLESGISREEIKIMAQENPTFLVE